MASIKNKYYPMLPFIAIVCGLLSVVITGYLTINFRAESQKKQKKIDKQTLRIEEKSKTIEKLSQNILDITNRLESISMDIKKVSDNNVEITEDVKVISTKTKLIVTKNSELAQANRDLAGHNLTLSKDIKNYQTGGDSFPKYRVGTNIENMINGRKSNPKYMTGLVEVSFGVEGEYPLFVIVGSYYNGTNEQKLLDYLYGDFSNLEGINDRFMNAKFNELERKSKQFGKREVIVGEGIYEAIKGEMIVSTIELPLPEKEGETIIIKFNTRARNGNFHQIVKLRCFKNDGYFPVENNIYKSVRNGEDILLYSET